MLCLVHPVNARFLCLPNTVKYDSFFISFSASWQVNSFSANKQTGRERDSCATSAGYHTASALNGKHCVPNVSRIPKYAYDILLCVIQHQSLINQSSIQCAVYRCLVGPITRAFQLIVPKWGRVRRGQRRRFISDRGDWSWRDLLPYCCRLRLGSVFCVGDGLELAIWSGAEP